MNCPGCGRFMSLDFAKEMEKDVNIAAFWWYCSNGDNCLVGDNREYTPAPEYDFEYWYRDIPTSDLLADPELMIEYNQAKASYENRTRRSAPAGLGAIGEEA